MPDLIVSVSHRLSQDEALRRIQTVVAQAKTQYSDKVDELRDCFLRGIAITLAQSVSQASVVG